jgi:hypothetical protein
MSDDDDGDERQSRGRSADAFVVQADDFAGAGEPARVREIAGFRHLKSGPRLLAPHPRGPYLPSMAASERVQRLVEAVRQLSESERVELDAELLVQDAAIGAAWGEEIDRRAHRVLGDGARGLSREQVATLFAMPPAQARAELAKVLESRR